MVIAIVGALAIVATTLGVVFYEEIAGEEELKFELVTDEGFYADATPAPVGASSELPFSFAVPDNATSADFDVTITFRGRSGQGSDIQVSAYFVGPTGNRSAPAQDTLTIAANNQNGGQSITLNLADTWATMPAVGNSTDIDAAAEEATVSYAGKLITVYVTIGANSDALSGIAGINYAYDVEVAGDLTRFQRAAEPVPNPTGGP